MLSRLGGGFLDIQTDRHTNIHTDRHYKRDRGITPVGMLSRLGGGHLDRQTYIQTYIQTDTTRETEASLQ